MSLLLSISIILGVLALLFIARLPKKRPRPCAVGLAGVPMEILIVRRLHGSAWVLHWKNLQGWGYEFAKATAGGEPCDRVALAFTNIVVEIHGTNLKPIKAGVIASTLSLIQEVTDEEVRILSKHGEPVIKKIEVMPVSVMELQVKQ
jgi:hypothetical protein